MVIAVSFDIEPDLHTNQYDGIIKGIPLISKILAKHNIKATFFTTCDCIEKHPKVFQQLEKQGHEIALHGYRHNRFDELNEVDKEEQIKKSVNCFQKYLKSNPEGFRAPQFSIDNKTLRFLQQNNFKYDSSYPSGDLAQLVFFPNKFQLWKKQFFSSRKIYKINQDLYEIPTTSAIFPFTSLLMRIAPLSFTKIYFKLLKIMNQNIIFYAHSWDFIETPESKTAQKYPTKEFLKKFSKFLEYASEKNKFHTMRELIQ